MSTVTFEAPRGMRDFYPEDMVWRNRIFDAWRAAAERSGFRNYDACVVESLELLQRKSGEEVSEQIYAFEDKSGRKLALRPEMTPTLARMVAARHGSDYVVHITHLKRIIGGAIDFLKKFFTIFACHQVVVAYRVKHLSLGHIR